ncbi:MAG: hypothetical protein C0505_05685 [Leptothrix sp. (in: Bacteria)]|nr:hypothetical protein [Leptothrix sp. (in: b-proteobacteria)]
MLLAAAASRQTQRALHKRRLMRARLLERLAERRGEPEPGAFCSVGLMSTPEQLPHVPPASVVAPRRWATTPNSPRKPSPPWPGRRASVRPPESIGVRKRQGPPRRALQRTG